MRQVGGQCREHRRTPGEARPNGSMMTVQLAASWWSAARRSCLTSRMPAHGSPSLLEAVGQGEQREVGRIHLLQLFPPNRRRHRARRMLPRRKRRRDRLAPAVLVEVEEDLSSPGAHRPLDRHVTRMVLQDVSSDRAGDLPNRVVVQVPLDREIEVETGAPRGLDERDEAERVEQIADAKRQRAGPGERLAVELRLRSLRLATRVEVGIEIEDHEIGVVEHRPLERRLRAREGPAPDPRCRGPSPLAKTRRAARGCPSGRARAGVARFSQMRYSPSVSPLDAVDRHSPRERRSTRRRCDVEPARAAHHGGAGRTGRRPRDCHVPADLQARVGRLTRGSDSIGCGQGAGLHGALCI